MYAYVKSGVGDDPVFMTEVNVCSKPCSHSAGVPLVTGYLLQLIWKESFWLIFDRLAASVLWVKSDLEQTSSHRFTTVECFPVLDIIDI